MSRILILLLSGWIFGLTACSNPGETKTPDATLREMVNLDSSVPVETPGFLIFSDANCSLPCLDGIIPGSTRASDAIQILYEQAHVFNIENETYAYVLGGTAVNSGAILWDGVSYLGNYSAGAEYNPNSGDQVILRIFFSLPEISLGSLIDELGLPTHARSFDILDDIVGWGVDLTWRNLHFIAHAGEEGHVFPAVDEEIIFTQGFFYASESTMENPSSEDWYSVQFEWDGFKDFEDYRK